MDRIIDCAGRLFQEMAPLRIRLQNYVIARFDFSVVPEQREWSPHRKVEDRSDSMPGSAAASPESDTST